MRKLIRNLALLLLPVALYYGVFLGFAGSQGLKKAIPGAAGIAALWQYEKAPTPSVILGDSRLAHFDMELVSETAGRPFTNLAYGGAALREVLDEAEWLLERYPAIDEMVLGLSFYTLNANYGQDRFGTIRDTLYNPTALLTSLSFNLEMLQNLQLYVASGFSSEVLGGGELETEDPAAYVWEEYTNPLTGQTELLRTRIIRYLADISGYTRNWRADEAEFERLLDFIGAAAAKGVRVAVVLPPVHPAVLVHEAEPNGITAAMLPLIARLGESGALVLDYEFTEPYPFREDQYFDGFHLDYVRGLPEWTEALFTALRQ